MELDGAVKMELDVAVDVELSIEDVVIVGDGVEMEELEEEQSLEEEEVERRLREMEEQAQGTSE